MFTGDEMALLDLPFTGRGVCLSYVRLTLRTKSGTHFKCYETL